MHHQTIILCVDRCNIGIVKEATMADTCVWKWLYIAGYKKDNHLFTFDMEYKEKNRYYVNSNITSEIIPKDETISGRRAKAMMLYGRYIRLRDDTRGRSVYTLWMWMMCLCVYKFMKRPPINQWCAPRAHKRRMFACCDECILWSLCWRVCNRNPCRAKCSNTICMIQELERNIRLCLRYTMLDGMWFLYRRGQLRVYYWG